MADKEKYLGEFEQLILLAILRVNNDSYGIEIADVIRKHGNREVSLGALYITLTRLQTKGLVRSKVGEATAERGGKAKKYFSVTSQGQAAMKRSIRLMQGMTEGVSFFAAVHAREVSL